LIDVAMSLLQLVFYDHHILQNAGLQRYELFTKKATLKRRHCNVALQLWRCNNVQMTSF